MQDWLSARAAATPDEIAMIVQDKYYSYHSVNGWVYFFGGHFRSIGIKAGTRVAVLISTNIDFAAVVQTLAAMRVILVPLIIRLTPTEIKWHIEFSKCDVLLYSEELKSLASL
ncbi:MAG: AMP-binding protein, partial [Chloroflexota bacterium]